jgi:hypothetical protein
LRAALPRDRVAAHQRLPNPNHARRGVFLHVC